MDKAKVKKRIVNLSKVRSIVEIAKFHTMKKIAESNKIKNHHYKMAKISQDIINYAKKQTNKNDSTKHNSKTLWIYITIPNKLMKVSYGKYEKILTSYFDKENDGIITLGEPATNYSQSLKYQIIKSFNDLNKTSREISDLILHHINYGNYDTVKILSVASKHKGKPFTIFPILKEEYNAPRMKKMKFFYSLTDTMEQISYNYIHNIISGIYQETYRNYYAEKMARHESSLKTIDEKLVELKQDVAKENRKEETEEMIQVIQTVKRK